MFGILRKWKSYSRGIILIGTPILLLPLPLTAHTTAANCAYLTLIMAVYWISGVLHLAVVSLLPIAFFPLLGVMDSNAVSMMYMKDTNAVYLACIILGLAVEISKIHQRIALLMLIKIGTSPKRLLFGVMLTTMTISMWIMNTVAAAMMIPIVEAIFVNLESFEEGNLTEVCEVSGNHNDQDSKHSNEEILTRETSSSTKKSRILKISHYKKCILLSIAYAANIGGTGTATATSPNIVFTQIVTTIYGSHTGISYARWMLFGVPTMLVLLTATFGVILLMFIGARNVDHSRVSPEVTKSTLRKEYANLGPLTYHEGSVLVCFISLILLFFFRKPHFMNGWETFFYAGKKLSDAVPAICLIIAMCSFPASLKEAFSSSNKPAPRLLDWNVIQKRLPWDLILLQGCGYALAAGFKESGLDFWLGQQFAALEVLAPALICLLIALFASFITEVASNASTAVILLPIVARMAENLRVNPLYFTLPATMGSSYSFMLPIAHGSNALVFKSCEMKTKDMIYCGFVTNCVCVAIMFGMLHVLGPSVYGLNTFPEWAQHRINSTVG